MADETVVTLIKDLTAKLSAVAEEFTTRAEQIGYPETAVSSTRDQSARLAMVRTLLDQRRQRRDFLPEELFHEPAWDMLLALYLAWHEGRTMNVKTLVSNSEAPVTTSQRWIDHLAKLALVTRVVDPADRRRIEVTLSESGLQAIDAYLTALD
ncbi:hypothetical protein [Sphingomonas rubra]|uniref:DNA-binding transcriptional regulator, MarR family n=1 Tax=Sphingomonas rubra TaxID=634430 RepID=A0A1I5RCW1_9SPHN|nr:hypothetical protein [Sphingomonas rubra]SFP56295.1 hypothetical protein SAMN04488241_103169 [Sphingomonas rubra]